MCARSNHAFSIRLMTCDDIEFGMRLKTAAGWNQTEADWRRLIDFSPNGVFVAEVDGTPVGTLCNTVSDGIGWIGMVLVDEAHRRQGVATRLVEHSLETLQRTGTETARLDATPLGKGLYERLGFSVDYELLRYEGIPAPSTPHPNVAQASAPSDFEQIYELDVRVKRTNRRGLLERFFQECPDQVWVYQEEGRIAGYVAVRQGTRAWQIGPCMALHAGAGQALFETMFHRFSDSPIFIDLLADNQDTVDCVTAAGLTSQRPLTRMTRGPACEEDRAGMWSSWGPEKG